jgi:hypothetical protein
MATNSTVPVREAVIEIPGEPGLLKTHNLPSEIIPLPLKVDSRALSIAVLPGLQGLFFLFGAAITLLSVTQTNQSVWTMACMSALGLFMAAVGTCFAGAALTAMADDSRRIPVLAIDDAGIWDTRSVRFPLAWSDIAHAKIIYAQASVGSVRLKLRRAIPALHNPFRIGILGSAWWRQPDELHVAVMGVDIKPRLLALAITTMVQRHGGTIDTKHPYNGTAL